MCPERSSKTDLKQTLEKLAAGENGNHPLIRAYLEDPLGERMASLLLQLSRMNRGPGLRPPSDFLPLLD